MIFAVEQEKGNFKGRVFGGFNRHDVIDYIEKLAGERNDLLRENQKLQGRIEALEERLERAEDKRAAEEARSVAAKALEDAKGILEDVISGYEGVCGDININVSQAAHELGAVNVKLTTLQETLKSAGERLDEVREKFGDSEEAGDAEDL